jgi:aspartate-semialdehyde dehydrogenase
MKRRVAVLGATGIVGQRFVQFLADHPWFELELVMASERSAGKNLCTGRDMGFRKTYT